MALAPKFILLTSGTSWTVPADWNSNANQIHLIGGGGGGNDFAFRAGGGGGYTRIDNFAAAPGATITYAIGAGGAQNGGNGGNTTFNAGAYSAGGGTGGSTSPPSGGVGSTSNGGAGDSSNATGYGGGAGGPNGNGVAGSSTGAGDNGFGGLDSLDGRNIIGRQIWPGVAGSGGGCQSSNRTGGLYGGGGTAHWATAGGQGAIIISYISSMGFIKDDPTYGQVDFDDYYVTDSWLIDRFAGSLMYATGSGGQGRAGYGDTTFRSSPIQIGSFGDWAEVFGRSSMNAGIRTNGALYTWGNGGFGQLGLGDRTTVSSPVQVGTLTNWKQVGVGVSNHMVAVKTDGTLWAWGFNSVGQLGQGNTTYYSSPVQVGALTNWKQVSASFQATHAIKTDGTLWAWGSDSASGVLGIGQSSALYSSPVQVGSLTNWKTVMTGNYFVLAIKTDGTLWSWGGNTAGELGLGDTTNRSSPVQVGALTNWKYVASNGQSTAAIKTDGTLWSWGINTFGQLGLNDTTSRSSPVQVGSLTNWKYAAMGNNFANAVKTDGTLWAIGGRASSGQLGLGDITNRSSPVQVGALTNWKSVGAGSDVAFFVAITDLN